MAVSIYKFLLGLSEGKKLLLLFFVALIVRLIGINYGYWFGDERINDAAKVLTGQLVPGQHYYPPLLNYINAVFYVLLYIVGRLFTAWYSLGEFRAQYFADPTPFYMAARFFICLASSAVAPLFYLIAREINLSKSSAMITGVFGIFVPGLVLLSHISKSDVPLAVSSLLVFYLLIRKYKTPDNIWNDIFLGLGVSLAMSFKHSYVFILAPLVTCFLYLFYKKYQDVMALVQSLFTVAMVCFVFWCIFNIGIILDFQNFLDYQKIQAVMSVREDKDLLAGLAKWWSIVANLSLGVNALVTIVFLLFPIFLLAKRFDNKYKNLLLVFWVATVFGSFIIVYLSGARQQSGLWVPYMVAMQLLVILFLCHLLENASKLVARLSGAILAATALFSVLGTGVVAQQAIAKPIVYELEHLIREVYHEKGTKILSAFNLKSPPVQEMRDRLLAREQWLADKYSVELPPIAEEKLVKRNDPNALNYYSMPSVIFGLEATDDESLDKDVVKAYAWPLQKEDWKLDYWLDEGFEVIIFEDHHYTLEKSSIELIKAFHWEVKNRCELVKHFEPVKPLYIEFSATVYDCARARS